MGFSRSTGGWSLFSYLLLFILGYFIYSNTKIQEAISKYKITGLIAIVLFIYGLVMYTLWTQSGYDLSATVGPAYYYIIMLVRGLRVWCWIIAILGFAKTYLNFNEPFLKYANETVLPFYILRQFMILIIGFFVVRPILHYIGSSFFYLAR